MNYCVPYPKKIMYENSKLLTVATANCQLIHNKIEYLLAIMIRDKIDICAINETWFNEGEDSKRKLTEVKDILKKAGFIIPNIDRPKRGGGVGIIYRQNLQIKQLNGLILDALELGLWHLTIANKTDHIMGIYHLPKSITNKATMDLFFEELSDYLTENIDKYEELITLGDTNIHYDLRLTMIQLHLRKCYTALGFNNSTAPHIYQDIVLATLSSKIEAYYKHLNPLQYGRSQTNG